MMINNYCLTALRKRDNSRVLLSFDVHEFYFKRNNEATSISHFRCLTLSETVWVCIFVPRTKYRSYHQEIKTLKTIRLNASYMEWFS
ncbi:unnamed protein product [Rhizophagus irregularis]|uniref:Uncharacterized protein n=1 Tax=Rhizophagus irregularis TaxID=588596 RepID=A0A915YWC8_9GLOM|nr:unnamed protein product [Rhizophagus irregularis]